METLINEVTIKAINGAKLSATKTIVIYTGSNVSTVNIILSIIIGYVERDGSKKWEDRI
jgi:ethanolamine utilization microcompartment shell protein EutL